jgi:alpha-beta hydrolase superfamily lysophospholipase
MTSVDLRSANTVVLLHGLGLGRWAMARLEHSLRAEGYRTVNLTYPSRTLPLEQLAAEWLPAQLRSRRVAAAARVHFVTHSMGGIVLRTWLREEQRKNGGRPPAGLGRVVMLAPPNQGSAVADRLRRFPPFRWFTGVNGARLGTGADSLPRALGPWPAEIDLGVIAGDRTLNPLFSAWLDGANDGKVAVASTRLAGMRDHLVLPHSHTWLQWRADTARAVGRFLQHGCFGSPAPTLPAPPS